MQTGENEQALRKIIDMTRLMSIILLFGHSYYYCYGAFKLWELTWEFGDKILASVCRTGLFDNFYISKLASLGFLLISLFGAKGRKDEKLVFKTAFYKMVSGGVLYFLSGLLLLFFTDEVMAAVSYMTVTALGFLLMLSGGTLLSRLIRNRLVSGDVFNSENETFPQEERLLENEYSINLPARYYLKSKLRSSWINFINPMPISTMLWTSWRGRSPRPRLPWQGCPRPSCIMCFREMILLWTSIIQRSQRSSAWETTR